MSEDLIKQVQSLIESGQGDTDRLRYILDNLQKGKPLYNSDQNYLKDLAKQSMVDDHTADNASLSSKLPAPFMDKSVYTSPSESSTPVDIPYEKRGARSTKWVAIVAAIIGILILSYVASDVYAVTTLQFRPHHGSQYIISQTQLFIQGEVCNPSYFPASFNKYEINAFYKSESIEKADISGSTISPKTFAILDGEFDLNKDAVMKLQQENVQFDPTQAHITTTIYAPIFGVIPFSVVKEYPAEQFQQVLMNGPSASFSCG